MTGQGLRLVGAGPRNPADDSPRTPPHNFNAEMGLLGGILENNRAYGKVSGFLKAEHFADPAHGAIYGAAGRLIDAGQIADPVTLKDHFGENGTLNEIGGTQYLARLAAESLTVVNAEDYGHIILDRWLRRELINLAGDISGRAYSFDLDKGATDQIAQAEHEFATLAETAAKPTAVAFTDVVDRAFARVKAATDAGSGVIGLATGFTDLDRMIGGLQPAQVAILAGRPGMGKTTLAVNISVTIASAGKRVFIASLEMSADELALLAFAKHSGISAHAMLRGTVGESGVGPLDEARRWLAKLPIQIDDSPQRSVGQIQGQARRFKPDLIVVDHLGLVDGAIEGEKYWSETHKVTAVSGALKGMAKRLGVPVLALCQLNRAVEQREDKKPILADLRQSGAIEQDADLVLFLYREILYADRTSGGQTADGAAGHQADLEAIRHQAEVIIAKQRLGPVGSVKLYFDGARSLFENWTDQEAVL